MSPSALPEDRAPSCMLYSMVECRAQGSRTHPWPCRAMPGNSVQSRCAPRREGKVEGFGGHSSTEGGVEYWLDLVLTHVLIALTMSAARSWGRHHAFKKRLQQGGGWGADRGGQNTGLHTVARPHQKHSGCCSFAG